MRKLASIIYILILPFSLWSQTWKPKVEKALADVEPQVIAWRHHIHQNPELSNREFKTAELVANHMRAFGLEVQTGIAHTGVVAILKGGKPGPVIALRADMDALPVTERVDIPWASKVRSTYNNIETGVMHACGHDTHVAMLMGAARILSEMRDEIPGTIKFIFQPAEEGAPEGEEGGAKLMVREGVLQNPDVEAIFGIHINAQTHVGKAGYTPGGALAAADKFTIEVKGTQTHGSSPWAGADPISTSAQIINALQTVVSRKANLLKSPAVVTVGSIHGGIRNNIIPESLTMIGTIRTLDTAVQNQVHADMRRIVTKTAEANGLSADIVIDRGTPVTFNDPDLTEEMLPALQEAIGVENVFRRRPITGAEDFAFYSNIVPGFFYFLGGCPPEEANPESTPSHHTPDFFVDDAGMIHGVKAHCYLALDYLHRHAGKKGATGR